MNPTEPVNPGGGVAESPLATQNPAASPDISRVEDLVAAAQQAAAAQAPKDQFVNQFGSGSVTPPVAESDSSVAEPAPDLMATALANLESTLPETAQKPEGPQSTLVSPLDPSINTVDDLLAKGPQVVEAVASPEETPAEKLKQEISDKIDAFLEETAKEKTPA